MRTAIYQPFNQTFSPYPMSYHQRSATDDDGGGFRPSARNFSCSRGKRTMQSIWIIKIFPKLILDGRITLPVQRAHAMVITFLRNLSALMGPVGVGGYTCVPWIGGSLIKFVLIMGRIYLARLVLCILLSSVNVVILKNLFEWSDGLFKL